MLRITLRDVLGVATLSDVTEELSNLADAILDATYRRIREEFVARHGETADAGRTPRGFLGDRSGKAGRTRAELQLGHRPDVRIRRQRDTDGPNTITNKEFYKK